MKNKIKKIILALYSLGLINAVGSFFIKHPWFSDFLGFMRFCGIVQVGLATYLMFKEKLV